ncbi:MAG: thiamine-phosphate kinase [Leptolyngbyaceae cyanobacterium RU_5_1]|nr:thiamine-phosphate kinase [Leptolyngbyaceae cyanobacterium RU_5_1]
MRDEAPDQRVQDIGEQGLLKRLQAFCPADIVGDDAAVLDVPVGRSLIVTTDVLVDRVHFSDRTTSPEDVGWRAAAANLSDLAAMGAMPLGITVGLGVPGDLAVNWVERLYQGLTDCLRQYGTVIVGGDVVRSPIITIAITAFGEADPNRIIRRSTARSGDAIVVTGIHGASRAGLELLLHPEQGQSLNPGDRTLLIQAHQRPKPRLDVLPVLWRLWDKEDAQNSKFKIQNSKFKIPLITGMDSSDGLADAVIQLCRASGIGARIERNQIPIPPMLIEWVTPEQAMNWALYGGEDFELVLCLPPEVAQILVDQLGDRAAMIGTTTLEPEVWLVDSSGSYPNERLTFEQGFQHFG